MNDLSLLKRVDIVQPLDEVLKQTCLTYNLGSLLSHEFLPDGFQELNIHIKTESGNFIVKIFSKEKTLKRIHDNIWGYITFRSQGVPMPTLRKTHSNEFLFPILGVKKTSYLCVMDFIQGNYLLPKNATDNDLLKLTNYMALIHKHTKRIGRYYDTMGIANFLLQYKKFNKYLADTDHQLLHPIVERYSSLPVKQFRSCIIHGTFEPENILKQGNELSLLDLGCMDFNAAVYDIATFIANFTLDLPQDKKRRRMSAITKQYCQTFSLSLSELQALSTLIRAQYATIYLRTNYYRIKLHDVSKLTLSWNQRAKRGLEQWANI